MTFWYLWWVTSVLPLRVFPFHVHCTMCVRMTTAVCIILYHHDNGMPYIGGTVHDIWCHMDGICAMCCGLVAAHCLQCQIAKLVILRAISLLFCRWPWDVNLRISDSWRYKRPVSLGMSRRIDLPNAVLIWYNFALLSAMKDMKAASEN